MNDDWQEAVDDIITNYTPRMRRSGEFTIYDYVARQQKSKAISLASAERLLRRLVDQGILGSEPDVVDLDGRRRRMYWRISQDEDQDLTVS